MTMKPALLMGRPDHFGVTYRINPWMDPTGWASEAAALGASAKQEWRGLTRILKKLGADLHYVAGAQGLPDLVFTANAAVVMDGTALLARFRHPERQGEEALFARAFKKLAGAHIIADVRALPAGLRLEGAGDCVWDKERGNFWMGYGPRSDRDAAAVVEDCFGLETVALELADPRFYHMDTALCPLSGGELLYVPCAFTREGLGEIADRFAPALRIVVPVEDAVQLAANAVNLGRDIVLSQCGDRLRGALEERGYRVHENPLGSFNRSGGSAFCLTLRLDHRSRAARSAAAAEAPALAAG
jgi:N-dimethylarginine dimethylaminohydrolase